jgi:hypothetical protein
MFTWIGRQGVRSSDGFEVKRIDRFSIAYREGSQVVTANAEREGDGTMTIESDAFRRWDNLRITNSREKQAQMRKNWAAAGCLFHLDEVSSNPAAAHFFGHGDGGMA